jgi:sirohydrochlorin cobaltochelatase
VTNQQPSGRQVGELGIEPDGGGWLVSTPGTPAPGVSLSDLLAWARSDVAGRYRPLPGARSLRPGLRVRCSDAASLRSAIDAVYPLATTHLAQHAAGELRIVPLRSALDRQTGRYEAARSLSAQGEAVARAELCGRCLKAPVWAGALVEGGAIPCPEPCSVMVSLCREIALWEPQPPAPAAVDATVPFAAFETPGNEVREATLASLKGSPRE